jgi:hypothetical protein
LIADNGTSKNTQIAEPFQESAPTPGISQKDFPEFPDEPFPDEPMPLGGGVWILLFLSAVYGTHKFLKH